MVNFDLSLISVLWLVFDFSCFGSLLWVIVAHKISYEKSENLGMSEFRVQLSIQLYFTMRDKQCIFKAHSQIRTCKYVSNVYGEVLRVKIGLGIGIGRRETHGPNNRGSEIFMYIYKCRLNMTLYKHMMLRVSVLSMHYLNNSCISKLRLYLYMTFTDGPITGCYNMINS